MIILVTSYDVYVVVIPNGMSLINITGGGGGGEGASKGAWGGKEGGESARAIVCQGAWATLKRERYP